MSLKTLRDLRGQEREQNAVGKVEDRHSGGGRRKSKTSWSCLGAPFLVVKTPVNYRK